MQERIAAALENSAFFGTLPSEIYPALRLRGYESGDWLMTQGEPISELLLLVRGHTRVRSLSAEGKSVVVDSLSSPTICGDIELLNHSPSLHSVVAVDAVSAIAVPQELFFSVLMQHPPFLSLLCYTFAEKLRATSLRHSSASLQPLSHRLARYLKYELAADGQARRISMTEAAQSLGVTTRHLRRVLAAWEARGILRRGRGTIALCDAAAFEALLEQAES